jgi:cyclopropane fatty-acyl-phospholipid synthase-like methyltransferase
MLNAKDKRSGHVSMNGDKSKTSKPWVYFHESLDTSGKNKGGKERARHVMKPMNEYNKNAKKILEIGCGLGDVLVELPERLAVYGLDIERDFIEACRKRMPKGKFYVSSMHNFKIDERFDVIFSVFDAMNELKDFDQWKSTFKAVDDHLDKDGLFIFDVFTPKILRYAPSLSTTRPFSKGYYFDRAIVKGNSLTWDVKIFERLSNGLYQLNEYKFPEKIYPVAKMKSALSKHFDFLETNLREEGRNILFVCRKKAI